MNMKKTQYKKIVFDYILNIAYNLRRSLFIKGEYMKKSDYRTLLGYQNAKTSKGSKKGYLTGIMYLAPANTLELLNMINKSKESNLCPFASKGCKKACLFTAGRGGFNNVKEARINKTKLFFEDREFFMRSLISNIDSGITKAKNKGYELAIRLNGTSDIRWEDIMIDGKNIFDHFPDQIFYDYTKDFKRFDKELPKNYHLTFSMSEGNFVHAISLLEKGVNVAVVFDTKKTEKFNKTWLGYSVIDGDETDLRFLDKKSRNGKGKIVALRAKGDAKKDKTGFVRSMNVVDISLEEKRNKIYDKYLKENM